MYFTIEKAKEYQSISENYYPIENIWEKFCKDIKLNQGISFVPQLCFESDIEDRDKRIINVNEIINLNFELSKQINK